MEFFDFFILILLLNSKQKIYSAITKKKKIN